MGKRIIQQARGKGSLTYRVRKKAFSKKISFPSKTGEAEILSILHSPAHSAPLIKAKIQNQVFYLPAFNNAFTGQIITISPEAEPNEGNILPLRNIPTGTRVFNVEKNPGDGGKMMRAAGTSTLLLKKNEDKNKVTLAMSKKKEIELNADCRAVIGIVAGDGKLLKPFVKAGRKYHKMKARSKLYPKVSAVAVNAIDHPFGSGRGKRIKSKIAKRNAPSGRRVGHIRPRRTGYKK